MRICHASNFLPDHHTKSGGAESACYLVAKGLEEKGIASTVLTLRHDKENYSKLSKGIKSMENIFGKKIGRNYKIMVPFDPIVYFSAKKYFKKFKPDLLHLHNFSFLSLTLILAAKKMKIPIVYSIYDYWSMCPTETLERPDGKACEYFQGKYCKDCFKERKLSQIQSLLALIRKPIFNWFLKQISIFITLSENSSEILMKYGIPLSKIKIIRLPMLGKSSLKIPKKIEENSIFFAGWIEQRKGLHVVINAMPEILKKIPSAKLYALGMGAKEKEITFIKNLITKLGLEKNIFFTTKRLEPQEFKKIFSKSSIVVVPEQWVNMSPVILLESMSFSKPVIASKIGGLPEFVKNDLNGKIVEPSNVKEWEKAICELLQNKRKLNKMRVNAGSMFKKIYNYDRIFSELTALYENVINQKSKKFLVL